MLLLSSTYYPFQVNKVSKYIVLMCRAMTGLILAFFLSLASNSVFLSASEEADVPELKAQYRLLIEERSRLLKRNRFLSAELRLALSNVLYLVIHVQPPVIQLKTQATFLNEYEVSDLHMDRALWEQIKDKGVVRLSLQNLREMSSNRRFDLAEPQGSPWDDEDRSISTADSLSNQHKILYALELDQHTTLYVQPSIGPQGRMRSFLKNIGQWFGEAWRSLFAHRKAMVIAVDERDALKLFRSLQVGMSILLVE